MLIEMLILVEHTACHQPAGIAITLPGDKSYCKKLEHFILASSTDIYKIFKLVHKNYKRNLLMMCLRARLKDC